MLKYLIVQLSSKSTSFCHYNNNCDKEEVISIDDLKEAILFSMKENLTLQLLYPETRLAPYYDEMLSKYDCVKIASVSSHYVDLADVIVYDSVEAFNATHERKDIAILLLSAHNLKSFSLIDESQLLNVTRLNIVIRDMDTINEKEIEEYKDIITNFSTMLESVYSRGGSTQVNVLSDLLFEEAMNNCNAGLESVSVGPNGYFYLCPAFYYDCPENTIGTVKSGLDIKNPHLLHINYAPICRKCDSFHCKRCVWLNQKLTGELNTPSKEQCVMSHIERNTSRVLLAKLRTVDRTFAGGKDIPEINYLDPFELIRR